MVASVPVSYSQYKVDAHFFATVFPDLWQSYPLLWMMAAKRAHIKQNWAQNHDYWTNTRGTSKNIGLWAGYVDLGAGYGTDRVRTVLDVFSLGTDQ